MRIICGLFLYVLLCFQYYADWDSRDRFKSWQVEHLQTFVWLPNLAILSIKQDLITGIMTPPLKYSHNFLSLKAHDEMVHQIWNHLTLHLVVGLVMLGVKVTK